MDRTEGLPLDAPCGSAVKRPRQNRCTPWGTIEATHHKGTLMGNRGDLHAPDGSLGRQWRSRRWISCLLDTGDGWKAPMDEPGHYYPLFFHDEAVALAAGHRPCGECRPDALAAFIAAWKAAHGFNAHDWVSLSEIDRRCHQARVIESKCRRSVRPVELPEGVFVAAREIDRRPLLKFAGSFWPWQHGSYGEPIVQGVMPSKCVLLTPSPMVAALNAGYVAMVSSDLQRVANYPWMEFV